MTWWQNDPVAPARAAPAANWWDRDPLAKSQEQLVNERADAMIPRPEGVGEAPQARLGDQLKPLFGGHNPVAEVADLVYPQISPEDQAFRDSRGVAERALDTAAFAASAPVRMLTRGEYGLGDVVNYVSPAAGEPIQQAEADFARANGPALNAVAAFGEVTAGLPLGTGPVVSAPARARMVPRQPVPQTELLPARAAAAANDLQAFERQNVRPFGPAFGQGPIAASAKQLSEMPLVGQPVRDALEESITGLRDRVHAVADDIAPQASYEQAGSRMQMGLDRFRTRGANQIEPGALEQINVPAYGTRNVVEHMSQGAARDAAAAAPLRPALGANLTETATGTIVNSDMGITNRVVRRGVEDMTDDELFRLINTPSDQTSFAARQEGLYERAWRMVPGMERSNGTQNPNLVAAHNTRQAMRDLDTQIANDISGQTQIGGPLAERLRNVNAANFPIEDLRAIRTEVGRALNEGNPLKQSLDRSQLKRLYGALSEDIGVGLDTLANRAITRTQATNGPNPVVDADTARIAAGARRAMREADLYTRMGMGQIDRFLEVIGADSPEAAARTMVRAAYDGDKGNARRFRGVMNSLRAEERSEFSSLVLRELGTPAASARGLSEELGFSVSSFVTNWSRMSEEARGLLFLGEQRAAINDLVAIGHRMANVEALANTSRTATNAAGLGTLSAAAMGVASGNLALVLGPALAQTGLSLLLSRPAYARWAVRYANLRAVALRSPQGAKAQIEQHVRTLRNLAEFDPQLAAIAAGIAADNGLDAD